MKPGTAGLLVLGTALLIGVAPPSSAKDGKDDLRFAPGPPRDPVFQKAVDDAIERGVAWVRTRQQADGTFADATWTYPVGLTALGVHVLRSGGAPFDDPAVTKGVDALRKLCRTGTGTHAETYELALALLALEAHYAPAGNEGTEEDGDAGGSRYGKRKGGGAAGGGRIPSQDLDWVRAMAARIVTAQDSCGAFGYRGSSRYTRRQRGWDHSNTQYAVLGLKAARRFGVKIDPKVFRRCLDHLLADQQPSGPSVERRETADPAGDGYGPTSRATGRDRARGWAYNKATASATGSMTTGGVSSMVICRGELLGTRGYPDSTDARAVRSIRDGVAWLGHHFSVTGNPTGSGRAPAGGWHYYYLYGLERAGVLAGVTWMADHDWYLEGANYLLSQQGGDGAWGGNRRSGVPNLRVDRGRAAGNLLDTCFALLFLRKATFRVAGAVATEESDRTLDLTGAADLDEASFRAVFDSVYGRYARAAEENRSALGADFVRMGTRSLGLLILRLEAASKEERATALDALRRVTGLTHGFDADAVQEVRSEAVGAWERWYFSRRRGLVADVPAGRFRPAVGGR